MKAPTLPAFKKTAAVLALGVATSFSAHAEEVLNFYNWSDYIAEDTIPNFEKKTGIKVTNDVFDSNEVLEAKMLAGNSGYDIVVPSSTFMARQIQAGVFQELDKSKIPNYKGLDKGLMKTLAKLDPDNKYGIPYLWGTTGIGYNVKLVEKALGKKAPVDSWDLIFKPENLAKLKECGVSFLDSADEIYPLALNYVGGDPSSQKAADYKEDSKAAQLLKDIRPYVTQFHSSQYINNLANGDICVAIGWSGDILQAMDRADEAENGVELAYSIPVEGTAVWFDMLTIPKSAKNADNAYAFINYLLEPKVMADISNYVWYPNAVPASKALLDEEISSNTSIYPTAEVQDKLFPLSVYTPKVSRLMTRFWANLKAGR
jgi:putrescine transport system substrate-binding protein